MLTEETEAKRNGGLAAPAVWRECGAALVGRSGAGRLAEKPPAYFESMQTGQNGAFLLGRETGSHGLQQSKKRKPCDADKKHSSGICKFRAQGRRGRLGIHARFDFGSASANGRMSA